MFLTMSQLGDTLKGIVEVSKGAVRVLNEKQVRGALCSQLLETAVQHKQIEMRGTARWMLKMLAERFGIHLHSLDQQYLLPKIQIHTINSEIAHAVFRSAKQQKIIAFLIEIRSQYTSSFSAIFITSAIQTRYQGTLFLKDADTGNEGLVVGEGKVLSEALETDLDQYFKKFKQSSDIQQSLKTTKIEFSLKDEIALAGREVEPAQHHILFSSPD